VYVCVVVLTFFLHACFFHPFFLLLVVASVWQNYKYTQAKVSEHGCNRCDQEGDKNPHGTRPPLPSTHKGVHGLNF
jgi:hypothetical protein